MAEEKSMYAHCPGCMAGVFEIKMTEKPDGKVYTEMVCSKCGKNCGTLKVDEGALPECAACKEEEGEPVIGACAKCSSIIRVGKDGKCPECGSDLS